MNAKQLIQHAVEELPDDCTIEDAQASLYVLQKIHGGLAELDRGEGVPHEDVKKQVAAWKQS